MMRFIPITKPTIEATALADLAEYLRLRTTMDGEPFDANMLHLCFEAGIDSLENEIEEVILARNYQGRGDLHLPFKFDAKFSKAPSVISIVADGQIQEPSAFRVLQVANGFQLLGEIDFLANAEMILRAGEEIWEELSSDKRFLALALAAHHYENRFGTEMAYPLPVRNLIEKMKPIRIGLTS